MARWCWSNRTWWCRTAANCSEHNKAAFGRGERVRRNAITLGHSEATLWNPTYAEAFLRLGESAEKMKDKKTAHEAYEKYIALAPNEKQAEGIKKKLASK